MTKIISNLTFVPAFSIKTKFIKNSTTGHLKKVTGFIINGIFWICILIVVWIGLQVFIYSSFRIPSDSMAPELITGDNIVVNKGIPGARIFNIFNALEGEQVGIYRLPGFRKIRRNDIVVFNFPHPNTWEQIEMDIMQYYVKRCIGLPGDTLEIIDGKYTINGTSTELGNIESQNRIAKRQNESFEKEVFNCFPYDSIHMWNIKDFGPLYIPKAGDCIVINHESYPLYKKLIEWEIKAKLEDYENTVVMTKEDKILTTYRFKYNYYFMAGDRSEDSQDSRYWGLLPEDYIVGKATFIWKSIDRETGKIRWKRFLKTIH